MRLAALIAVATVACAQSADPYLALRARDYDTAIPQFLAAIAASPRRADLRKDLAYTYLKTGEPVLARDQFKEASALDPADTAALLEYAFLCYETKLQAEARRTFDRLRSPAQGSPTNATAEQAFQNIDAPLATGIDRWLKAIALGGDNFSAHFELATLAEQRDDLPLAATHYERAWRLLPDRRTVLVDLGRVWHLQHREADAQAALLAASRGGEPYAAELARGLLPTRYPFVPEFRAALALDPANHELRRELAYLLLRMKLEPDAEAELRILVQNAPADLLSATQLGFILYARGETLGAQLLFDRVLAGSDDELANRVRAVLHIPQLFRVRDAATPASIDAKVMAERSLKAGYMKDALKYLEIAHESDPGDFDVMLKLGWANNILHRDAVAVRWFDLARRSSDPKIATEAGRGYRALYSANRPFRLSAWVFPFFSTRWHDAFGYGQVKVEANLGLRVHPYVSARVIGNREGKNLSENNVIFALGVVTDPWRRVTAWGEAGLAVSYLTGSVTPDYRGGINYARTLHRNRWFAATTLDALYISRFDHDFLVYSQSRAGYSLFNWNFNVTADARRQEWANFVETGPGLRIPVAESLYLTFNALRGRYLIESASRPATFNDFRAGFWYAFSR